MLVIQFFYLKKEVGKYVIINININYKRRKQMGKIVVDSYAKINLALDVINKRKDGYHNICTVMQEISLKDRLEIGDCPDKDITIKSNNCDIPLDEDNLVHQAWELMKEKSGLDRGVKVLIDKKIPVAAGLAGGSSNAAAMLIGLNHLWNLNYTTGQLEMIGAKIGADVPFCLRGGTLLASGIGNIFEEIKSFAGRHILLINPGIPMDTRKVYESLSLNGKSDFQIGDIVEAINLGKTIDVSKKLYNKLEEVVLKEEHILKEIKMNLIENKALGSLMSGSGTTIFGIFESEEDLNYSYDRLREKYPNYIIIKTKTR